jgi:glutamate dehydrogenase/leucine dehydrogenase
MRVDLVEWLPGVRIEQRDGCGEEAFLVPSGTKTAVSAVAQVGEMAHQFCHVLGAVPVAFSSVHSFLSGRVSGLDERDVHDVLGHEPDMQLVTAKDVAHQEIVGSPIAALLGLLDGAPDLVDDRLVRVE